MGGSWSCRAKNRKRERRKEKREKQKQKKKKIKIPMACVISSFIYASIFSIYNIYIFIYKQNVLLIFYLRSVKWKSTNS